MRVVWLLAALASLSGCASGPARETILIDCPSNTNAVQTFSDGQFLVYRATDGMAFFGCAVQGRDVILGIGDRTVALHIPQNGASPPPLIIETLSLRETQARKLESIWFGGACVHVPRDPCEKDVLCIRGVSPHFWMDAGTLVTPDGGTIPLDKPGCYAIDRFAGASGTEWKVTQYLPSRFDWDGVVARRP